MCTYVPKYYISTTFSLVSGRFLTMFALLQQASKGFILYMSPQIFSICPWGDSRKKNIPDIYKLSYIFDETGIKIRFI